MDSIFGFIASVVIGAVVLTFGLAAGVTVIDKHYTKINCAAFERETGRNTRYAEYNWWSYDCLAETTDGKWLPTDNLREIVD